ncbi:hypothetical protein F66182_9835 [Fusarium sp. NRRL 66182]|nr:hypothetical protein F66182_9835 [Fusarium sp. NRRL 66182]
MSSIIAQKSSVVGIMTEARQAEPRILSLNRAIGYSCDNVTARIQAHGAHAHAQSTGGDQSLDQNEASLAVNMAAYQRPTSRSSATYGSNAFASASLLAGVGSLFD